MSQLFGQTNRMQERQLYIPRKVRSSVKRKHAIVRRSRLQKRSESPDSSRREVDRLLMNALIESKWDTAAYQLRLGTCLKMDAYDIC